MYGAIPAELEDMGGQPELAEANNLNDDEDVRHGANEHQPTINEEQNQGTDQDDEGPQADEVQGRRYGILVVNNRFPYVIIPIPRRVRERPWWGWGVRMTRLILWPMLGWVLGVIATLVSVLWMNEYPCEAEPTGWREAVTSSLTYFQIPEKFIRRFIGAAIPQAPPFGRVFLSYWLPFLSLLPGQASRASDAIYHYVCTDSKHLDYSYHYTYDASHERFFLDSASGLVHIIGFELLLSAITYLAVLLALNLNIRNQVSSTRRIYLKLYRLIRPARQAPARPIEKDDICPFCHEPFFIKKGLSGKPCDHGDAVDVADVVADVVAEDDRLKSVTTELTARRDGNQTVADGAEPASSHEEEEDDGETATSSMPNTARAAAEDGDCDAQQQQQQQEEEEGGEGGGQEYERSHRAAVHCRWGCGKAVHADCVEQWLSYRNTCVFCNAPWL